MELTPGLQYTLQRLPRLAVPPALVYFLSLACQHYGVHLSTWVLLTIYASSLPAAISVSVLYNDWINGRDAAACGAVLPPAVDSSPGGIRFLIGALRNFKTGYPGDGLQQLCQDIGYTMNARVLFQNRIFTAEPEYIKAVLATQFDDYGKSETEIKLLNSVLGMGVFNSDGEMWKFHRAMTRPFFNKERISHFDIFDRHAEDAINQLSARLREGYPVDFQDMVSRFTLDSATEFLFGNNVHSLSAGLPYPFYSPPAASSSTEHPANAFARAFAESQNQCALRARYGDRWPLFEFFSDKTKKSMSIIHRFINPILAEATAMKATSKGQSADTEPKEGDTLLEHLVNYTDGKVIPDKLSILLSSNPDHTILRDEILNIMIAGRDTTASLLTFTVYMLAQHPYILTRLREEILQKIGPSRRPTYDDLRDMKYLRAVLNETLRLYSPVPFNMRTTRKPVTWPSKIPGGRPFYIPAHTRVPYSVLIMHRRTDLWGPDAREFDPDRFLDHRLHKYLTPNPFIFLPFNAGPRICLGQQFAYNEASFFLVRLLQRFSGISLASDAQPPSSRPPAIWAEEGGIKANEKIRARAHFTLYLVDGLWVTMKEE